VNRAILAAASLLSLAAAPVALAPASAADLYVDGSDGHDSAPGTQTQPFETIGHGVQTLQPGDTLHILSGVYYEGVAVTVSGTEQQPIIITGDGPTRPVVKNLEDAFSISGSYIQLLNVEAISLGEGSGIAIGKGNHHVRIAGDVGHDSGCGGIAAQQTDYITIEDNVVYGNAQRSPYQCSGISIYQAKAIDQKPGFHNIIRRNISYANMNLVVDDRITHSGGKTTDGNGIIIDDFRNTQGATGNGPYAPGTLVENNLAFDNGGRGINVFLSDNVLVRNNTAYFNLKDKNLIGPRNAEISVTNASKVTVVNNIAIARDKKSFALMDSTSNGDAWDWNLTFGGGRYYAEHGDARWGGHNMFDVDPKLHAASTDPTTADFHPRPESPVIAAGAPEGAPSDDLDGHPRAKDQPPTIGAYEPVGKDTPLGLEPWLSDD
jgi:parallel beta-helix repeat protein